MTSATRLLEQLSALTTIRDIELLELTLLQILHSTFRPMGLELLNLDTRGRPHKQILYEDGRHVVRHEGLALSSELESAIRQLRSTDAGARVLRNGETAQTIYGLYTTYASSTYLIVTAAASSGQDAQLLAGLLKIYRNYCRLLRDSQTDQLTGLANRKTFDECANKVYELLAREKESFPNEKRLAAASGYWLAMVDIDHFKSINDRFGHLYGDEVLVLLAQMLRSAFRDDDLIFRFGGEEFVLMIRSTDQETTRRALQRLCDTVESHEFPQVGRITISIGATRFERETFAVTLLDYADQALYHSKKNGRNQVTFFESLLAEGITAKEEFHPGSIELF